MLTESPTLVSLPLFLYSLLNPTIGQFLLSGVGGEGLNCREWLNSNLFVVVHWTEGDWGLKMLGQQW